MPSKPTHRRADRRLVSRNAPSGLRVDLYELTMAAVYLDRGLRGEATFEVSVRNLPASWGCLIAAGRPAAQELATGFQFTPQDIDFLRSTDLFDPSFLKALLGLRFTGRLRGLPEGCPFFAGEPILEVKGPLPEAQLLETVLLNGLQLPILAATKAARCVRAAQGRPVFDFAMRRCHGLDSAHQVARSAYLAGMAGTSNVEAARRFGIPLVGTMGHSYVLAFPSELDAFRAYAASFPERAVLLVDTYDTLEGVRHAAQVGREMRARGQGLRGIRLDSGDLGALAQDARDLLDAEGLPHVQIVGSGGLDEYRIADLMKQGAPFDSFGVGTALGAPPDAPALDIVYKLVSYEGRPVAKRSAEKTTRPGAKQVFRSIRDGRAQMDRICKDTEAMPSEEGRWLVEDIQDDPISQDTLLQARARHTAWIAEIPASSRRLRRPDPYPVETSAALLALEKEAHRSNTP